MALFAVVAIAMAADLAAAAATGLWGQCRSKNGAETVCGHGLVCVPDIEYYGLCYTAVVPVLGQCGGWGWNVTCAAGGSCERQNDGWATCVPALGVPQQLAEWQQCDLEGQENECAEDLVCVDDNDYHGLCVKKVAEMWGQCGGSGWTTKCAVGSRCGTKDIAYSQCLPDWSSSGSAYN